MDYKRKISNTVTYFSTAKENMDSKDILMKFEPENIFYQCSDEILTD